MSNLCDVVEQEIFREENVVHKIVRLDARQAQRQPVGTEIGHQRFIGQQRRAGTFVHAPGARGGHVHGRIRIGEQRVVRLENGVG